MSTTFVRTVHCDAPDCTASFTADGIGGPYPDGWVHIRGRSAREWPISRTPRDFCPQHTAETAARGHIAAEVNGDPR